ncbi:MAG: UDP-N-acetylmuramoyl-L-alanine--D-glutamate ligase [bacterium]
MQNYKEQFKGKKITVMGLGLLGGALNDILYLVKHGAILTVTDLKDATQLKYSLDKLKKYPQIKFTLGEHNIEDFKNTDMVVQPGNVPIDSPYLVEARKNNIPIFVSESLFAKYATGAILVGVTGTRGKSMTTALIYEILKENIKDRKVYLGGNVRNVSTLALLDKIKPGDIVVMELDSWALHGMGDIKISPHISVFTSFMPDHMNYYGSTGSPQAKAMEDYFNDKALIYRNQKKGDVLVTSKEMKKLIGTNLQSKIILADKKNVSDWKFIVPGDHQRQNLAYAVEVARQFDIPISKIKKTVAGFKGVEGRLQLLRNYKGIKIYNDNNATTPEAVIAGIKAVKNQGKNIILICGGSDKKVDLTNFVKTFNKECKFISMIPGTGTDILIKNYKLRITNEVGTNLKEVVSKALVQAKKGDVVLFSPGFASFGMFTNEYERNDLFVKIIKKLK